MASSPDKSVEPSTDVDELSKDFDKSLSMVGGSPSQSDSASFQKHGSLYFGVGGSHKTIKIGYATSLVYKSKVEKENEILCWIDVNNCVAARGKVRERILKKYKLKKDKNLYFTFKIGEDLISDVMFTFLEEAEHYQKQNLLCWFIPDAGDSTYKLLDIKSMMSEFRRIKGKLYAFGMDETQSHEDLLKLTLQKLKAMSAVGGDDPKRPPGGDKQLREYKPLLVRLVSTVHSGSDEARCFTVILTPPQERDPEWEVELTYEVIHDICYVINAARQALQVYPPCSHGREGWVQVEKEDKDDILQKFKDSISNYLFHVISCMAER